METSSNWVPLLRQVSMPFHIAESPMCMRSRKRAQDCHVMWIHFQCVALPSNASSV